MTPILLLTMRNSFKEVIYALVKGLVQLDVEKVTKFHCDKFATQNNILHYATTYDRFVAVYQICESVFQQEYTNLKSKQVEGDK